MICGLLFFENLDCHERAVTRARIPEDQWTEDLNPRGEDARLFNVTQQAAREALGGGSRKLAAAKLGRDPAFLAGDLRRNRAS